MDMANTQKPDDRRRALRQFMADRDLKIKPWCERAGVNPNNVYNFLNGRSDSLSRQTLEPLAAVVNASSDELMGTARNSSIKQIAVVGAVQAGVFKEVMEYQDKSNAVSVPLGKYENSNVFALDVRGPSMNREYAEGSILVCVPLLELQDPLVSGDHVIVHRTTAAGSVEATCKELKIDLDEKTAWLWPRSDHPEHQVPIHIPWNQHLPDKHEHEGDTIEIVAVVIWDARARKRV